MSEELYSNFKTDSSTTIKQYLLTGKLYEKYTDLNYYGVRIEKIRKKGGGAASKITSEIHRIFFRREDIDDFMKYIHERQTSPEQLENDMKLYIDSRYIAAITA